MPRRRRDNQRKTKERSMEGNGQGVDRTGWKSLPEDIHYLLLHYMPLETLLSVCSLVCRSWRNYIVNNGDSVDQSMIWYHLSRQVFGVHDYRLERRDALGEENPPEESATLSQLQQEVEDRVRVEVDWKHYYVMQHMFEKYHANDVRGTRKVVGALEDIDQRDREENQEIQVKDDEVDDADGAAQWKEFRLSRVLRATGRPQGLLRHSMVTCTLRDAHTGQRSPILVIIGNFKGPNDTETRYDHLHPIVHTYDLNTKTFTAVSTTGDKPGPTLWRHTATVFDNSKIAVFGGSINRLEKLNSLHILNMETQHWEHIQAQNRPVARSDHCSATVQNRWIYVFGGSDPDVRPLNDLHRFDLQTMKWSGELQVHGFKPPARSASQMVYMPGLNQLCIFGGGTWSGVAWTSQFHDVWMFDIASSTWLRIKVDGYAPPVGTFPGVVTFDHFLFVVGGAGYRHVVGDTLVFNAITQTWTNLKSLSSHISCDGPGICAVLEEEVPDDQDRRVPHKSNCIYIYGGFAGNALDHFYRITMQWRSEGNRVLRTLVPW